MCFVNLFKKKTLRQKVLSNLSKPIKNLLDYIEEYAKIQIEFLMPNFAINSTDPNPKAISGEFSSTYGRIFIRSINEVNDEGILFMLLLMKRHWVEKIPQIVPAHNKKENYQITSSIERVLERLTIIPEYKHYGLDPYPYWNKTMKKILEQYDTFEQNPWARKKQLLLDWLTTENIVKDENIKKEIEKYIEKAGMLPIAKLFNKEINEALYSKEYCINIVAKYLNIPIEDLRLRYYDVINKKQEDIEMTSSKKKKKSGSIGWVHLESDGKKIRSTFLKTHFSTEKENIEFSIANAFVTNAIKENKFPFKITNIEQNTENHLDFEIRTDQGTKFLELMEIAPLEKFHSYEKADDTFNAFDFAEYLKSKITIKSNKYIGIKKTGVILLVYNTDWRFNPGSDVIQFLQFWFSNSKHSFERIYCYEPLSDTEGYVSEIFPIDISNFKGFDPNSLKAITITNLDPTKWQ